MSKRKVYSMLIGWMLTLTSVGQVMVNFSPAVNGLTLDGLALATINNTTGNTLTVYVLVSVKTGTGNNVVSVKTSPFQLRPGNNLVDRVAFANGLYAFADNNIGYYLKQSRRFLEGEYEYCYEVNLVDNKNTGIPDYFENCFTQSIQPFTPLFLVNPDDGDQLCNTRPVFNWQPPMPLLAEMRFRLQLVELKNKQTGIEALTYNTPVIYQENIVGNILMYPPAAPALAEGSKYAWQVTAYTPGVIITKSEIWTFTAGCDSVKKPVEGQSYRELKTGGNGGYLIVQDGVLRFSLNNPYQAGKLNYSIENLSAPGVTVKHLPVLNVNPGINKYDLDLGENSLFKEGEEYLLKVYLPSTEIMTLRFIYKNDSK